MRAAHFSEHHCDASQSLSNATNTHQNSSFRSPGLRNPRELIAEHHKLGKKYQHVGLESTFQGDQNPCKRSFEQQMFSPEGLGRSEEVKRQLWRRKSSGGSSEGGGRKIGGHIWRHYGPKKGSNLAGKGGNRNRYTTARTGSACIKLTNKQVQFFKIRKREVTKKGMALLWQQSFTIRAQLHRTNTSN